MTSYTNIDKSPEARAERNREKARRDYHKNIERRRAVQNARRQADPEKARADARARRAANPEAYKGYGREEQLRRRQRMPWLAAFHSRRKHAEKIGIDFTLTYEWARATYSGYCVLTGLPFDVREVAGKPGPRPHSVSIDKIDQTKGYTPDNCRFVLNAVNTFRGTASDVNMLVIAKALLERNPK